MNGTGRNLYLYTKLTVVPQTGERFTLLSNTSRQTEMAKFVGVVHLGEEAAGGGHPPCEEMGSRSVETWFVRVGLRFDAFRTSMTT
jgi:hypothetical protein